MIAAGEKYTRITMHKVDARFDTGDIVAKSDRIRIPPGVTPADRHKITSVSLAKLMASTLEQLLEGKAASSSQAKDP